MGNLGANVGLDIGRQRFQQTNKNTYTGESASQNPMQDLISRLSAQMNQYNAERNLMFGGEGYGGSFQSAAQQAARAQGKSENAKPWGGWGGYGSQNATLYPQYAGSNPGGVSDNPPGPGGAYYPSDPFPGGGGDGGGIVVGGSGGVGGNPSGPGTSTQVDPGGNPIYIDTIVPPAWQNPTPPTTIHAPGAGGQTSTTGGPYTPPPGYVPIGGPGGGNPEDYYTAPAATTGPTKTQVSGMNQTSKVSAPVGGGTPVPSGGPGGGVLGSAPTSGERATQAMFRAGSSRYAGNTNRNFNEADPYADVSAAEARNAGYTDPNMVVFRTKRLGYGLPAGVQADSQGYFTVPKDQASQFASSNYAGKTNSFLDPYAYNV